MINSITIAGRLTRDPELRTTENGISVTTFTVACDRGFGEKKETDFIPIVTWRGLAENCERYLSKGKMCAVTGRLQIRTYENKDGEKRTIAEIVANDVQFLTPKGEGESAKPAPKEELEEMEPLDDIPF